MTEEQKLIQRPLMQNAYLMMRVMELEARK